MIFWDKKWMHLAIRLMTHYGRIEFHKVEDHCLKEGGQEYDWIRVMMTVYWQRGETVVM